MDNPYVIHLAVLEDVGPWMDMVHIVKDNFPGLILSEYQKTLEKNIERQTAICVKCHDQVVGVLLFSIHSKCLSCMAVHPLHRNKGIGSAQEAIRLGAVKAAVQYGPWYVTMLDPEGHPFCLCKRQGESEFEQYFKKKGFDRIPNPSVNIDCTDVAALRGFYAKLTNWDQDFHWTALVTEQGMVVHFMECDFDYIKPVWPDEPGKQQKQMHFNFQVDDLPSAVIEAVKLGATKPNQQFGGEDWVTLLDPQGHPFCLCRK